MRGIIDNPELIKVIGETLSLVIADSAERGAGKLLGRVKGDSQRRLIARALTDAVAAGFVDAKQSWIDGTESWVSDVADIWRPAFGDPHFVGTLIDSLASPRVDESADLKAAIVAALEDHGCDPSQLGSIISVDQFLYTLRRVFWERLQRISREEPELRALAQLLLAQRADARYTFADLEVSPRDYLQDIAALLGRIVDNARDVPAFLPGSKVSIRKLRDGALASTSAAGCDTRAPGA